MGELLLLLMLTSLPNLNFITNVKAEYTFDMGDSSIIADDNGFRGNAIVNEGRIHLTPNGESWTVMQNSSVNKEETISVNKKNREGQGSDNADEDRSHLKQNSTRSLLRDTPAHNEDSSIIKGDKKATNAERGETNVKEGNVEVVESNTDYEDIVNMKPSERGWNLIKDTKVYGEDIFNIKTDKNTIDYDDYKIIKVKMFNLKENANTRAADEKADDEGLEKNNGSEDIPRLTPNSSIWNFIRNTKGYGKNMININDVKNTKVDNATEKNVANKTDHDYDYGSIGLKPNGSRWSYIEYTKDYGRDIFNSSWNWRAWNFNRNRKAHDKERFNMKTNKNKKSYEGSLNIKTNTKIKSYDEDSLRIKTNKYTKADERRTIDVKGNNNRIGYGRGRTSTKQNKNTNTRQDIVNVIKNITSRKVKGNGTRSNMMVVLIFLAKRAEKRHAEANKKDKVKENERAKAGGDGSKVIMKVNKNAKTDLQNAINVNNDNINTKEDEGVVAVTVKKNKNTNTNESEIIGLDFIRNTIAYNEDSFKNTTSNEADKVTVETHRNTTYGEENQFNVKKDESKKGYMNTKTDVVDAIKSKANEDVTISKQGVAIENKNASIDGYNTNQAGTDKDTKKNEEVANARAGGEDTTRVKPDKVIRGNGADVINSKENNNKDDDQENRSNMRESITAKSEDEATTRVEPDKIMRTKEVVTIHVKLDKTSRANEVVTTHVKPERTIVADKEVTTHVKPDKAIRAEEVVIRHVEPEKIIEVDEEVTTRVKPHKAVRANEEVTTHVKPDKAIRANEEFRKHVKPEKTIGADEEVTRNNIKQDITIGADRELTTHVKAEKNIGADEEITTQLKLDKTIRVDEEDTRNIKPDKNTKADKEITAHRKPDKIIRDDEGDRADVKVKDDKADEQGRVLVKETENRIVNKGIDTELHTRNGKGNETSNADEEDAVDMNQDKTTKPAEQDTFRTKESVTKNDIEDERKYVKGNNETSDGKVDTANVLENQNRNPDQEHSINVNENRNINAVRDEKENSTRKSDDTINVKGNKTRNADEESTITVKENNNTKDKVPFSTPGNKDTKVNDVRLFTIKEDNMHTDETDHNYEERIHLRPNGHSWKVLKYVCWRKDCVSKCQSDKDIACFSKCICKNPDVFRHTIYVTR